MNRLATALLVLAVVAGPPLLAGVWLLHHRWQTPTRAQIVAWAEQPLTAGTIITGCVAVAGLAWLLLLTHLTRRALAGLRRRLRRMRHLPVPTPAQMTASSMAGLAAFTLPATPTSHPQPQPATAGTPQPQDPAGPGHHPDRSSHTQPPGITLPGGGWIPYRTAAAITALAALVWLQRRRRYRPDPHQPRDHHEDPDLQPLPATIDTITTAVTDDETTRHEPAPLLSPPLPAGILHLTGPGAAAAARGLLITAALSRACTVSMPAHDLRTLLPTSDPATPALAEYATEPDTRADPRTSTVIALGDDPAVTHHWHITADGTATGTGLTEPRRLCTLNPQTTTDLLTLTHPGHPPITGADPPLSPATGEPPAPTPTPPTPTASLTLLGSCQLNAAGQPVHLRRTASTQILAYLAIHPQGATSHDLTHAIWPHLPAATISHRLHTTLADLRRHLRPLLGTDPITRHDDRYRLNTHAIATDLQQWRTAAHAMTHAVGTAAQHHACRNVIDAYHGELAAGHTWTWLTPAREQTRRTVIHACAALAEHADPDKALPWLRQAITIDPYNEPLHQQAADLLRATGDETGAADLIKRLHRRLADGTPTPP